MLANNIGLAQGTVLASLLFVLYINDINDVVANENECKIKLFADDTLIYICTDDVNEGNRKLNETLDKIYNYFCKYKMKLNVSKTKAMVISNNDRGIERQNIKIEIEGEAIEIVKQMKYFGLIIDDKLNMNENINYVCKKASKKIGLMNRIKHKLDIERKICIYKTIVAPHFDYCALIIFLSNENQFERMQKLQNKAMRNIMNVNKYTSTQLMLNTLGWLSIRQRVTLLTLKLIHKIIMG